MNPLCSKSNWKPAILTTAAGAARAGALALTLLLIAPFGCRSAAPKVLGVAPASLETTSVKALTKASAKQKVVVQGEMIEKCPVAGCWFILRDKTGTVRVDTKAAGFVVSSVPLHTRMKVGGTVTPGDPPGVAATGASY